MNKWDSEKAIAEAFLDGMLEAERLKDFNAWARHWDKEDLKGLNEEVFQNDLRKMSDVLGAYHHREYLGVYEGRRDEVPKDAVRLKFVWRMVYEKNEALSVIGIRNANGTWRPYQNMCHL